MKPQQWNCGGFFCFSHIMMEHHRILFCVFESVFSNKCLQRNFAHSAKRVIWNTRKAATLGVHLLFVASVKSTEGGTFLRDFYSTLRKAQKLMFLWKCEQKNMLATKLGPQQSWWENVESGCSFLCRPPKVLHFLFGCLEPFELFEYLCCWVAQTWKGSDPLSGTTRSFVCHAKRWILPQKRTKHATVLLNMFCSRICNPYHFAVNVGLFLLRAGKKRKSTNVRANCHTAVSGQQPSLQDGFERGYLSLEAWQEARYVIVSVYTGTCQFFVWIVGPMSG